MKKLLVVLVLVILFMGFSKNLIAEQKHADVYANFGGFLDGLGEGGTPVFFAGATLDLNYGSFFMISGNANILFLFYMPVGYESKVTFHLKMKKYFFGCGISKMRVAHVISEGSSNTLLTLDIGQKTKKTRVSLFAYSRLDYPFRDMVVGIQIGVKII